MNSAITLLLRCHLASRVRRVRGAFSSPRRTILTLAALALGLIWLGQTIASVVLRDPYAIDSFHRWTSLILALYFGWHFIRVAYRRPESAIEWSSAEAALIVGGPFCRRDVLVYRFLVILTSALPKALLTAFVLLPDLWWSGLPGIVLALVFLESFRMAIDIAACCLDRRSYLLTRLVIFSIVVSLTATVVWQAESAVPGHSGEGARLLRGSMAALSELRSGDAFHVFERPFIVFADVITAQSFSWSLVANSIVSLAMVAGLFLAIGWLDRRHEALMVIRQRWAGFSDTRESVSATVIGADNPPSRLPRIPRLASVGPIVWRQFRSAERYRGSLLVALAIPAAMSCLPLLSVYDPTYAFLAMVAAVVFYSFVLLPEAVKFDFRLDCDHLTQLKMLPISPFRLVVGQLAVPVIVATLFQVSLYVLAGIVRPVGSELIISAILLTLPVNVLFVAIDNLIFLLYPHRPTQEGFEAFLRTILKFTFKSVLLGVAGGFVLFWSLTSRLIVDTAGTPDLIRIVFVAGVCLAAWFAAGTALAVATQAFKRFDVSSSVPA